MTEFIDELELALASGRRGAVATIVRTRGSTPREVGARMIVNEAGGIVGTVGGGCGEADVWAEAMKVVRTGVASLLEVDLLHDHDEEGGRACGGYMYVFIEPFGPPPEVAKP